MTYHPYPGDIGLTQIEGYVGSLIRVGQWLNGDGFADYQHAFVMVSDRYLIEAMPGGARIAPLHHYDTGRILWLRCPPQFRKAVAAAARGYRDVPYSAADYFALAAHRLHIPAPHLKKYIRDSGHMICSQLADQAAMDGGWRLFEDGRWPGDVTPADLAVLARLLGPGLDMTI